MKDELEKYKTLKLRLQKFSIAVHSDVESKLQNIISGPENNMNIRDKSSAQISCKI